MLGANAWLLMCSIMIASLGLDMNSQAVIIGAMLISPLMSPILGVGLAIGIYDRPALLMALKHFGISIIIALITSTLYFLLTPFGTITPEILRRTEPTFLDVLVAFFGGVAGIISGSRKDQSNAIPGVAIATALMPPLCVTGFGIAKWLETVFGIYQSEAIQASTLIFNSFYLFFLNSFFVALATFLIVRSLRFPIRVYTDRKMQRRTTFVIVFISLLMLVPSLVLLSRVAKDVRLRVNADRFVSDFFSDKVAYIDDQQIIADGDSSRLILKIYGAKWNLDSASLNEKLKQYGLKNTTVDIISSSQIDFQDFNELEKQVSRVSDAYQKRLDIAIQAENNSTKQVEEMRIEQDSTRKFQSELIYLATGVEKLVDRVKTVKVTDRLYNSEGKEAICFLVEWQDETPLTTKQRGEERIVSYLRAQLGAEILVNSIN